jgi:hypothetical protein
VFSPVSVKNIQNPCASKPSICQDLFSNWSIYLTALHMIGQSKMNERLHDMTPNEMLLDVSVSAQKKEKKKRNTTKIAF